MNLYIYFACLFVCETSRDPREGLWMIKQNSIFSFNKICEFCCCCFSMFTKRKCLQLKKEMRPESLVFYNYLIALCTLERSLSFVFMLPHVTFQITLRDEQFLTNLTRKISLMPMNHSEQSLNIVLMKMMILYSKLKRKIQRTQGLISFNVDTE